MEAMKEYLLEIMHFETVLMSLQHFIHSENWIIKYDSKDILSSRDMCCIPKVKEDSIVSCSLYKENLVFKRAMYINQKNEIEPNEKNIDKLVEEEAKLAKRLADLEKWKLKEEEHLASFSSWHLKSDGRIANDIENLKPQLGTVRSKLKRYCDVKNKLEIYSYNILYLETIIDALSKIMLTLKALYSLDIIYPTYRNITAISSIYQYISSGRTHSLVRNGVDPGAYNMYEDELKANKIVNAISVGLTKIHSQLSAIEANQYTLFIAIQRSNDIIRRISKEISQNNCLLQQMSMSTNQDRIISEKNTYMIKNSIEKSSYFAEETARSAKILVDINRDRWGDLRNSDGFIIQDY